MRLHDLPQQLLELLGSLEHMALFPLDKCIVMIIITLIMIIITNNNIYTL